MGRSPWIAALLAAGALAAAALLRGDASAQDATVTSAYFAGADASPGAVPELVRVLPRCSHDSHPSVE